MTLTQLSSRLETNPQVASTISLFLHGRGFLQVTSHHQRALDIVTAFATEAGFKVERAPFGLGITKAKEAK